MVLPFEPVMPTIRSRPSARTLVMTSVARAPSAVTESSTTICGTATATSRSTISRAAPFATAASAKRCPSSDLAGLRDEDVAGRDQAGVGVGDAGHDETVVRRTGDRVGRRSRQRCP